VHIALEGVSLTLPGAHRALASVTLAVARGERVAVIGQSGAGKTSLLRVVGTGLRPTGGSLRIADRDPWTLRGRALRGLRARIGTIYQAPPLPPRQRVVTAVLAGRLGAWGFWKGLASLVYPADIAGARAALTRVDLADRIFDRCDRLSGGQLQRVGVARVLYQSPDLVVADEPVSALDPQLADQTVGELARDAHARGVTLIVSLHAVELALHWFPRIVGLRAGRVAFDLPPGKVSDALLRELYGSESAHAAGQPREVSSPLRGGAARSAGTV
jgi:phosphonate transport system ATP-binding protein